MIESFDNWVILWRNIKMIDEKWEDNVFMMAKHKLLEAIEKSK